MINTLKQTQDKTSLVEKPTSTKVYVRPVPRNSVQGRHLLTNNAGKKLGYTKAKGAATTLTILPNPNTGKLNLPFGQRMENPYFANTEDEIDPILTNEWVQNGVWKRNQISKQEYFEIKHGRSPGFYAFDNLGERKSFGRGSKSGDEQTYLQRLRRKFIDGRNELNLSIPEDEIWYEYIMHGSSIFARSKAEIIDKPHAKFYISHIDEDQTEKAMKNERLLEAQSKLYSLFTNHPQETWTWIASKLRLIKGDTPAAQVKNVLTEYVNEEHERDFKRQLEAIEAINMLDTPDGKERLQNIHFLRLLVNKKVVNDRLDRYTWNSQKGSNREIIGKSENEALEFLMNPENDDYVEKLTAELKNRL